MPKDSSVPSVLDPRCPSRLVLDRIADKWTALVIQILAGGTIRYAALQREIGGISQKMLTQTLRSLERDGLVQRTVHPVVPPKVEYSLTRLGRTLIEPLQGLCRWSEKHHGVISNEICGRYSCSPSGWCWQQRWRLLGSRIPLCHRFHGRLLLPSAQLSPRQMRLRRRRSFAGSAFLIAYR